MKENGEIICLDPGKEGFVVGRTIDFGYGDSPSITRREWFKKFQPGVEKQEDLKTRLQLLKLEKSIAKASTVEQVRYVISKFLEHIKQVNPKYVNELTTLLINEVLRYVSDKRLNSYEIAYICKAICLENGIYVDDSTFYNILKQLSEDGEIHKTTERQAKKTAIEFGLKLVLNKYAAIVTYGIALGLTHVEICKGLKMVNTCRSTNVLNCVIKVLYELCKCPDKLMKLFNLSEEKLMKIISKVENVNEIEDTENLNVENNLKIDYSGSPDSQFNTMEVECKLWRNGKDGLVIVNTDSDGLLELPGIGYIPITSIKLRRKIVKGRYISNELYEKLINTFGEKFKTKFIKIPLLA